MNDKYLLGELEDKICDVVDSYVSKIDKPYSIVLSGGFDSGLLTALTKPTKAYRIRFPYGSKFDESRYAEAIAKHLGIELIQFTITPEMFKKNFEEAVKINGEVTTHFSLVPLYILMKELKGYGETDVLAGEGPDEYLGGYARYIIFDELKKLYEIPELRNYHKMIDKVLNVDTEIGDNQFIWEYGKLIGYGVEDVSNYVALEGEYPFQGCVGKMDMELGTIEKMEQRLAKHFGINYHYPYINEEFAEYCYRLPDNLKIRNGVTKWGFKQICMKYLPEIMRDRTKMGGPVANVNKMMGWDLNDFDKSKYIEEQEKILK